MSQFSLNSISYLNFLLPSKQALYDILVHKKKYYMPSFESSCITDKYLLKVAKKQVFSISETSVKIGHLNMKLFVSDLMNILKEIVEMPLGMDENHSPNKEWLINCICTLKPSHQIFSSGLSTITRKFPSE